MESYLVDTQVVLFAALEPKKLSKKCCTILTAKDSELYLSYASVWELSIKKGLQKLELPVALSNFVERSINELGLKLLPIELEHLYQVENLPSHHRDPFDRLICAQAIQMNCKIISADEIFDQYKVKRIW